MPRTKKQDDQPETKARVKGHDALVTVSVETADGTVERTFRVAGFLGNTLPWQRTGKGLDGMLLPGLLRAFGGQVTVE